MRKWVSVMEKRSFLEWFLRQHRLKRTDAKRVLEFLIEKTHILENVSFTDKININERTIVISSLNSDEPGFEYYHNYRKTSDVATVINSMTTNPTSKWRLIIHFYGKMNNQRYLNLIEPCSSENIKLYEQYERQRKEVDAVITKVMREKEIENIKKQIDIALDLKDETLFRQLIEELKRLEALLK